MRIDELKRIAKENDYEYEPFWLEHKFTKKQSGNCIRISGTVEKTLWIDNQNWCDWSDFEMIKASVEFAETPVDERGIYED